jgi:serine/threonine-protein kinase
MAWQRTDENSLPAGKPSRTQAVVNASAGSGVRRLGRGTRTQALSPGERVGKFEIVRLIGLGATAHVYAAAAPDGELVAVKLLRSEFARNAEFRRRFELETRVLRALESPNAPFLVASGATHDEIPFIAMELSRGQTLLERLKKGPLLLSEIVEIGRQLLLALEHMHSRCLIHCDVKPSNLLIEPSDVGAPRVKLIDFGLCALAGFRDPAKKPRGTLAYMSPEQLWCKPLDELTDVYSAAAVLYTALAGRRPYQCESRRATLESMLCDEIPPVSMFRPGCPRELESVVMRGLSRRRNARHLSANAMRISWMRAAQLLNAAA